MVNGNCCPIGSNLMFHSNIFCMPASSSYASAWTPASLSPTNLRLWVRPEGSKFQDSARTTPAVSSDPCGSWTDESGNGFHANQSTSGLRPTVRANGGLTFSGSWLSTVSLGAWTGDFAVLVIGLTMPSTYTRFASVAFDTGWNLMNGAVTNEIISGVGVPAPPYGDIITSTPTGIIHSFYDRRVGTTHSLSIDGAADVTATVTGAALSNTLFYIGSDGGSFNIPGDIHEIVVVTAPSGSDLTNLAGYAATRMASGIYV